ARMPENPVFSIFGAAQATTMTARQMVVDSQGTVYALTVSGLSVVPLTPASSATQPQIATTGVVNASDGSAKFQPGSFITINGANLGANAAAATLPPPTVLGGSCVLIDDVAIPLLQTAPGQISAQIPASIRPGANVLQVRSLATAQQSGRIVVNIQKP